MADTHADPGGAHPDDRSPIAIICCAGSLPYAVADAVAASGRKPVLFAVEGLADPAGAARYTHHWMKFGKFGRFISIARAEGCRDVVLIGTLLRPRISQIRFDWATLRILPDLLEGLRGGDDRLIGRVVSVVEREGFRVVGAQQIAPEILAPAGSVGRRQPSQREQDEIARGFAALAAIGPFDVGQAVVIVDNRIVAIEAAEGTDGMLDRIVELRRNGRIKTKPGLGVLVKAPKAGQDLRFDLPTIGAATVDRVARAGLAGIAVRAQQTILAEPENVRRLADASNIFVTGVTGDAPP